MKYVKTKLIIAALFFVFVFFFSNDFGLIDIENTAIITAIAIDSAEDGYEATAQIAVPEATNKNSENKKAQISGTGSTIGAAIKDIGDKSGWFPNLQFCNVLIIGEELTHGNVFKVLDYFSKTLRVQDSAMVVTTDKKAKELLEASTPLDNISSFALQKILLKNPGFNSDVAETDIKNFCIDYYSESRSSYMPLVKLNKQETAATPDTGSDSGSGGDSSGGSGGSSSGGGAGSGGTNSNGSTLFNARSTALFYEGVKAGELNEKETLALSALTDTFKGTTIELKDVTTNGETKNFLITVFRCNPKIIVDANEESLNVKIDLDVYCRIVDQNAEKSDVTYSKNVPLPDAVKEKATEFFTTHINKLIEAEKTSGCDFLFLKRKLFQRRYKHYARYKDNFFSVMKHEINVSVSGQK